MQFLLSFTVISIKGKVCMLVEERTGRFASCRGVCMAIIPW